MTNKSIKKNYIFNLIHQIFLIAVPLITTPYVSRILLPDGVGKYSFTYSIITYFTLLATFGFENYAQREIAKHQDSKKNQTITFWELLIGRLIPSSISILLNVLLITFNAYGDYTILMQILTINIIAVAFDVTYFFQGNEEFGKLLTRNLVIKILGTIAILVFVKHQSDLWLYTLIHSLMVLVSNLSLWPILIKKLCKIKPSDLKPLKHIAGAFRLFVPALATSLYVVLDKTLIGLITQSSTQNGYYEQSQKIITLSMTLITCLGAVMIPRNSNEISQGHHDQVKENIYKACNFVWLLGIPLMFGMILISDNLIPWFLGYEFYESSLLLKLFSPLILIIGLSNILGLQYLVPYKREKQFTVSILLGSTVNLIFNFVLIHFWGSMGATISTIIAESIVTLSMILFLRKELSLRNIFITALKPALASTVMFLAIIPLAINLTPSILNTVIIIISACIVYGVIILILREKLTYRILSNIKKRLLRKKI